MPTMDDFWEDGSDHEACPECGLCLECDGGWCQCMAEYKEFKHMWE